MTTESPVIVMRGLGFTPDGRSPTGLARVLWWLLPGAVVVLSILTLWISASDHPLYPPDEGRYGSISLHMAQGGSWLIPEFRGEVHLTKPPLTYWAEAVSLRVFGESEAALRLPSLLASSLTLLLVFVVGWRTAGIAVGTLAVALLSLMPLHVLTGRLAITDPMLTFFWFSALVGGLLACRTGTWRAAAMMWLAVCAGLMTKGPVALTPVGVLIIWIALGGRWAHLRRLRPVVGVPLSFVPLIAWVLLVARNHPDAMSVWREEIVGRIGPAGDHPEPGWFFVPVFFAGLFPASMMLPIPGWHLSWRAAWARLRSSEPAGLWILAVVVPFIIFSLTTGKLMTYLLPLCPPLALLAATALWRWMRSGADDSRSEILSPKPLAVLTIVTSVAVLGAIGAAVWMKWPQAWMVLPLAVIPAACGLTWWIWRRRPRRLAWGLLVMWLAAIGGWMWSFEIEDEVALPFSAETLIERLHKMTGSQHPTVLAFGFSDPTLSFYSGYDFTPVFQAGELIAPLTDGADAVVLLADARKWDLYVASHAKVASAYVRVGEWHRWFNKTTWILRPAVALGTTPPPPMTQPPGEARWSRSVAPKPHEGKQQHRR